MIKKIKYKGQEIPIEDIVVEWESYWHAEHTGTIDDYARDYARDKEAENDNNGYW